MGIANQSGNPPLPGEQVAQPAPLRRLLLGFARLAIGLALLAYLVKSGILNLHALANLLTAWPLTLAAAVLFLGDMSLMAFRLSVLFRPQSLRLSLASAFQLTMVGQFFSAFLPGGAGGDVMKLYYAARENRGRRTEIVTIVLLDRGIGLFSLVLLPLLIAPAFLPLLRSIPALAGLLLLAALGVAGLLAGAALATSRYAAQHSWVLRLLEWMPAGSHARRMLDTLRSYRRFPGTLLATLGLGLVGNVLAIASTMLIGLEMGLSSHAWRMGLLIPLGQVANSVPLTPGGLGVGETAFGILFSLSGLRRGADVLLGWRLVTALVGLLGLLFYLQGLRRCVSEAQGSSN